MIILLIKNLRFVGANPCNYVYFNCDSNDNCETWRIVGIINSIDTDPVLKLAKSSFESTTAAWDSNSKNNWNNASLNATLNSTYLSSLNSGVQRNYLLNAQWNIGGVTNTNAPLAVYNQEKGTKSTAAYIGIINPSDFAYATGASNRSTCLTTGMNNTPQTCANDNYLYSSSHQWSISKRPNGQNNAIRITDVGRITNTKTDSAYNYRIVVHLKSNVLIDTENGDGTIAHPYILKPGS